MKTDEKLAVIKKSLHKLTQITSLHYIRLVYRSALLLVAVVFYVLGKTNVLSTTYGIITSGVISIVFMVEMFMRFFPSTFESLGSQKQFLRNYSERTAEISAIKAERREMNKRILAVIICWVALNSVFAVLFFAGIFDSEIMLLISIFYSVCDMICILFFCPFQSWIMKNRCCGSCRIYNWDYAMMFTPLLFVGNLFGYVLCAGALALLIRWEITYNRHPERFYITTNACLDCANCKEKLCRSKKSIRKFLLVQKQKLLGKIIKSSVTKNPNNTPNNIEEKENKDR